ncbi:MAG: zinc ribbon domain-containing protein [Dehalococcoidia bacterium]|nr:zinc ribbon domain-containing protein [Dehalococcoidia bacterium]
MPLYEYYCEPCNGVFELLRPAREASRAQPCPECDDDAKRIVSREFSAFIHRDGLPRRLPDDGGYWHLGKKVSQPLKGAIDSGLRHPDLKYAPRETAPTLEEMEQFEYRMEVKRGIDEHHGARMINEDVEKQDAYFRTRMRKAKGSEKVERAKQRFSAKERQQALQHARVLENEAASRQKPKKQKRLD